MECQVRRLVVIILSHFTINYVLCLAIFLCQYRSHNICHFKYSVKTTLQIMKGFMQIFISNGTPRDGRISLLFPGEALHIM